DGSMLENIKFQFVPLKDLAEIDKDNIVGKTLSVALNSILLVNPSIPEARRTKKL
ncbi:13477_t:CDS:2, partial [Entrophospora sp. SA101]